MSLFMSQCQWSYWHILCVISCRMYWSDWGLSMIVWLTLSTAVFHPSLSRKGKIPNSNAKNSVIKSVLFDVNVWCSFYCRPKFSSYHSSTHLSSDLCTGSRLMNTLNINSFHSPTKFSLPANLTTYTSWSLFTLYVEPTPHLLSP